MRQTYARGRIQTFNYNALAAALTIVWLAAAALPRLACAQATSAGPGIRAGARAVMPAPAHDRDRDALRDRQRAAGRASAKGVPRNELAVFDHFLDAHPDVRRDLANHPDLMTEPKYLDHHPDLHEFLLGHPGAREQALANPGIFVKQERRFSRWESTHPNDTELGNLDRFLDAHPEIAKEIRTKPGLLDDEHYRKAHPGPDDFLRSHPGVLEQAHANPGALVRHERAYDARSDSERGDGAADGRGERDRD